MPGCFRVIVAQVPLTPFDKPAHYLLQEFPGAFVALRRRLAEKAMRLFQSPVAERFLSLPEGQPREAKHVLSFPDEEASP